MFRAKFSEIDHCGITPDSNVFVLYKFPKLAIFSMGFSKIDQVASYQSQTFSFCFCNYGLFPFCMPKTIGYFPDEILINSSQCITERPDQRGSSVIIACDFKVRNDDDDPTG